MNPDKNYRMSKPTKTILSLMRDSKARKIFKDLMIKAELHHSAADKKIRRAPSRDTAPVEEDSAAE